MRVANVVVSMLVLVNNADAFMDAQFPSGPSLMEIVVKDISTPEAPALRVITDKQSIERIVDFLHNRSKRWVRRTFTPPSGSLTIMLKRRSGDDCVIRLGPGYIQTRLKNVDHYKPLTNEEETAVLELLDLSGFHLDGSEGSGVK